jgi:hypothetical protein
LIIGVLVAPLFGRVRCAFLAAAAGWLLLWDTIITEGALFRDYAGLTGPETPALLFRWGPAPVFSLDLGSELSGLAAGPLTGSLSILRLITVIALAALIVVACRAERENESAA